ncbi:Alcohol dehydrogenase-like 6 [Linum perenne]
MLFVENKLGTVGLSVAQGARLKCASRIIDIDTNPEKREKAKAFGVTDFINPNDNIEPVQQVIKRITDGGADYSFECIGDIRMGWGTTVTLGVPKSKLEVSAHYGLLLTRRTLKGTLFGGWRPKSDLPFVSRNEIKVDELITHDLPFEDINESFGLMRDGKCLGCVIHMPK